jgi:ATP synthase protein I
VPEPDDAARLRELEKRLAEKWAAAEPETRHSESGHGQAQLAWRMVIELVSGLGIGFGIGYGLDALFGTTPFLMVVFIFLGLAAGIKTMMRSAREVADKQAAEAAKDDGGDADGD